jgi:hypothetical protein
MIVDYANSAGSDRLKTGGRVPGLMGDAVDVTETEIMCVVFWCLTMGAGIRTEVMAGIVTKATEVDRLATTSLDGDRTGSRLADEPGWLAASDAKSWCTHFQFLI